MEWTEAHDVFLCREMLVVNPFQYKRKTTQRAKMWETVADHLERIDAPTFKVTVRSVRDRYTLISKKYKKRMQTEKRASGIVPVYQLYIIINCWGVQPKKICGLISIQTGNSIPN